MQDRIMSKNENSRIIAEYISISCVERSESPTLMYGKLPGTRYSTQFYLAPLLYNRTVLERIGVEFVRLVEEQIGHFDFQLAGREWSAIPLLAALPIIVKAYANKDINAFMVKRERKSYGCHNFIEGQIDRDKPVLIVDDLCNSTDSFVHCKTVASVEQKLTVLPYAFAVLNKYSRRKVGPAMDFDRYSGLKCLSICERDDIAI